MTDTRSPLWPQVDAFLQYLRVERQLSAKTRESYQRQLAALIAMASEMGLTEWRQLEVSQVRALATRKQTSGVTGSQSGAAAFRAAQLSGLAGEHRSVERKLGARCFRAAPGICRKIWMSTKLTICWISTPAIRWRCVTARCSR